MPRIYDEVVEALQEGRCADGLIVEYWQGEQRPSHASSFARKK
jgi:hypothetical protein